MLVVSVKKTVTTQHLNSSKHARGLKRIKQREKNIMIMKHILIEGTKVSVIFDGTTHVCEVMVIVLHIIDEHWCIKQRTARLMLIARSMTGEELARQLIVCLSTELMDTISLLQCMNEHQ